MSNTSTKEIAHLLEQAEKQAAAHDWVGAAEVCMQACALATDDARVFDKLGWYLSRAKQYEQAIKVYQTLAQHDPNHALWPYMLGYQYYEQGNWREAITCFDRALALCDTYLAALYRKGYAHTQVNEPQEAQQVFERFVRIWRDLKPAEREREAQRYADTCFQLGKLHLTKGRTHYAERWLAVAVAYDSSDPFKHYNFGKALFKNGKYKPALEQFRLADQQEPGKDYILVYIARLFLAQEQYAEAAVTLNRIPPHRRKPYIWNEIGRVQLAQDQAERARESFQQAVRGDRNNHNSYYLLGQAEEACGNVTPAITAYGQAVRVRRQRYNLAFPEAQEQLERLEQAAATASTKAANAPPTQQPEGLIKTFRSDRGYGFIDARHASDIFFHISDVANPDLLNIGAHVTFTLATSVKGPRATQISVVTKL
jgi:CspA family cold shock protein